MLNIYCKSYNHSYEDIKGNIFYHSKEEIKEICLNESLYCREEKTEACILEIKYSVSNNTPQMAK